MKEKFVEYICAILMVSITIGFLVGVMNQNLGTPVTGWQAFFGSIAITTVLFPLQEITEWVKKSRAV